MSDLPHVRRKWQPIGQFWPILAAGCFGLVVAVSAWFAVSIWEERLARATFNDVAGDYVEVLQNGLDEYVGKLLAVRAFYEASVEVDPDEFVTFTSQILDGQTDRMRIIWCPRVSRDERAEFERKQIENGLSGYAIKSWALTGPSSPSPERDEYFPVLYTTAASKLPASLGFDLNSELVRHQAIQRTRDGNVVATAQNIQLRNPINGLRPGFLVMVPVYRASQPTGSVEARRRDILGIVVGVFQTNAVISAILTQATLPQDVDLYLYPANAGADAMPLYVHGAPGRGEELKPVSEASLAGLHYWSGPVKIGDAHWNLVVAPVQEGLISYFGLGSSLAASSWCSARCLDLYVGLAAPCASAGIGQQQDPRARADRPSHQPRQSPRLHEAADHGVQCELARRSALRRALSRHRRLQGRERHARTCHGRPSAQGGGGAPQGCRGAPGPRGAVRGR